MCLSQKGKGSIMNFSKEQELIISLSRVTFENETEIIETKDINWFELV